MSPKRSEVPRPVVDNLPQQRTAPCQPKVHKAVSLTKIRYAVRRLPPLEEYEYRLVKEPSVSNYGTLKVPDGIPFVHAKNRKCSAHYGVGKGEPQKDQNDSSNSANEISMARDNNKTLGTSTPARARAKRYAERRAILVRTN